MSRAAVSNVLPRGTTSWLLVLLALCAASGRGASAHESRPAYLEIGETAAGRYRILWRTPLLAGRRLPVVLQLPDGVRDVAEPTHRELPDSLVERRLIDAPDGLAGRTIRFVGLQGTNTDVLVRVQARDGTHSTTLVRPSSPLVEVTGTRGVLEIAAAYARHGIAHIFGGYDHLLFVVAMLLIVNGRRMLLATVTAFTLAHSITLTLATLGLVRVAGPPVEAAIALSILLLACEIVRNRRGEDSITARQPWLVAFAFGLLHGFGFAGALADVGLPRGDIPLALLAFNVGVEVGQLVFIAGILLLMGTAERFHVGAAAAHHVKRAAPAAIGTMAAFWLFERLATF